MSKMTALLCFILSACLWVFAGLFFASVGIWLTILVVLFAMLFKAMGIKIWVDGL